MEEPITALYQLGIHCMCGLVIRMVYHHVHDSEEKRKLTSNIQHFTPSTGQWVSRATTGTPPLGVIGYSCTAIDDQLYYFGGYCGHGRLLSQQYYTTGYC